MMFEHELEYLTCNDWYIEILILFTCIPIMYFITLVQWLLYFLGVVKVISNVFSYHIYFSSFYITSCSISVSSCIAIMFGITNPCSLSYVWNILYLINLVYTNIRFIRHCKYLHLSSLLLFILIIVVAYITFRGISLVLVNGILMIFDILYLNALPVITYIFL